MVLESSRTSFRAFKPGLCLPPPEGILFPRACSWKRFFLPPKNFESSNFDAKLISIRYKIEVLCPRIIRAVGNALNVTWYESSYGFSVGFLFKFPSSINDINDPRSEGSFAAYSPGLRAFFSKIREYGGVAIMPNNLFRANRE